MEGHVLLESLRLNNFLSYGTESDIIELQPLNVLIGPNGSGKSNLIEAIGLLHAMPDNLKNALRTGSGSGQWVWKGYPDVGYSINRQSFTIEAKVKSGDHDSVSHMSRIIFLPQSMVVSENIELQRRDSGGDDEKILLYGRHHGRRAFLQNDRPNDDPSTDSDYSYLDEDLALKVIDAEQSVLSQIKNPLQPFQYHALIHAYSAIRIYRNWNLGRNTPPRQPQPTDLANSFLDEDASNLALIVNDLQNKPGLRKQLNEWLQRFNPQFEEITTLVYGNTIQLFLHEKGLKETIPATRLSDGTLQFLCLLTILCHPEPPPLVCIEEPELGLHPDVMPLLAELFLEASQRMQLIISTHSDALVSALSDVPEAILVCERDENGTQMRRLEEDKLHDWLQKYSLGDLWRMGEIGGVR